jgi:hypothetical protein
MTISIRERSSSSASADADTVARSVETTRRAERPERRLSPSTEDLPHASLNAAFVGALTEGHRESETQARLDAFRDSFSGPYVVHGERVSARPMFRMNGGFNDGLLREHESTLSVICRKASVPPRALADAKVGRPTPEELRVVTQALIDAGALSTERDGSLEQRIRRMQWEWGIGVDCAGYTEQAARAARHEPSRPPTHGDAFARLARDRSMKNVTVREIRSGDVIHLDRPSPSDVGHNVIVYAHRPVAADDRAALTARAGAIANGFFAGKGPFHLLEVDSSWGAGPSGADYGGFRRDEWLFDEGSSTWLYFEPWSQTFGTSNVGPHAEPYAGAYRPRER